MFGGSQNALDALLNTDRRLNCNKRNRRTIAHIYRPMDIYKKMKMFLCLFNGPDNTLCIYIYVYRFLLCVSPASPSSQKKRRNFGAGRLKHIIHPSLLIRNVSSISIGFSGRKKRKYTKNFGSVEKQVWNLGVSNVSRLALETVLLSSFCTETLKEGMCSPSS